MQRRFDPNVRAGNAAWGWIAAAVFLVVVLAVAFGVGHQPGERATNTAFNSPAPPPVMTHMNPPAMAPATPAPARPGTNP